MCFLLTILKRSHVFLLYTRKETNCVLLYDKIWLLILPPRYTDVLFLNYLLVGPSIDCIILNGAWI